MRMRSKLAAGGGGREKSAGLVERPWQWPGLQSGKEQSKPHSYHLLCHMSSQQGWERPAKPAKGSSHVAGHSPRALVLHTGPDAGRTPSSCSLSKSVLGLSLCPCPCEGVQGMRQLAESTSAAP